MPRLTIKRIFIKNQSGELFRVFGVANPKDSKNEFYIKLIFPYFGKKSVTEVIHDADGDTTEGGYLNGLQEFSYHYESGISHYKNHEDTLDQSRTVPTLTFTQPLHLLRLTIFDLKPIDVYEADANNEDIILDHEFTDVPRAFDIFIAKDFRIATMADDNAQILKLYSFFISDPSVKMFILDMCWYSRQLLSSPIGIFRFDNPTQPFRRLAQ